MVYEGISKEGVHSFGLATSADGVKWERKSNEPIFERSSPGRLVASTYATAVHLSIAWVFSLSGGGLFCCRFYLYYRPAVAVAAVVSCLPPVLHCFSCFVAFSVLGSCALCPVIVVRCCTCCSFQPSW